ncbi:MAG TPA: YciI family protein [Devosia sp.]
MKYLLLVHLDSAEMAKQTQDEWRQLDRASLEYDRELERSGHYITSSALADPKEAVIVRRSGDGYATTDGPFAEVKEHLGGFIYIEARDLNEAIAVAAKIPVGKFGAIEVRPTLEIDPDKPS